MMENFKKLFVRVFGTFVAILIVFGGMANGTADKIVSAAIAQSSLDSQAPLQIMPVGDSITAMPYSYRVKLYRLLSDGGLTFDFVGNNTTAGDLCFDKNHNGWSGKKIDFISSNIDTWLTNTPADIILLHIGTNDIFLNDRIATAPARLSALIDKIIVKSPNTAIYVASIIPQKDNPLTARNELLQTIAYNNAIPGIVGAKQRQGNRVYFVDMYNEANLNLSTDFPINDRVHPNKYGADKMADVWYRHLTNKDTIEPSAITNLELNGIDSSKIVLNWTAPGDDGAIGTATVYDIRYSNAPINEDNWGTAGHVDGAPIPQKYGTNQSYTVEKLNAGTTYYFAIKTGDDALNWSAVSNSPQGTTLQANINLVKNSGFESGKAYWNFFGTGTFSAIFSGYAADNTVNNAAKVYISSKSSNIQLFQTGILLEPNTNYRLIFSAYSSNGHDITANLFKHGYPYTNYGLSYTVDLSAGWQTFTKEFTTAGFSGTVNDGRLMFWLASFAQAGDVYYIDNVILEKVVSTTLLNEYIGTATAKADYSNGETADIANSSAEPIQSKIAFFLQKAWRSIIGTLFRQSSQAVDDYDFALGPV